MEREIVKEIKKLIDCDKKQNEIGGIIVVNRQFLMEVLNLINELEVLCNKTYEDLTKEIDRLESENERLKWEKQTLEDKDTLLAKVGELSKENQQLKDRIAELEKENATKTDTITDLLKKQEFYETEKLKQFAERLKEKFYYVFGNEYEQSVSGFDTKVLIEYIDETLKEFINKGDEER